MDDLVVSANGDVWFTNSCMPSFPYDFDSRNASRLKRVISLDYAWFARLTETALQLESATYRFRPSTGAVNLVEDSLIQPNGIAISPLGKNLYIGDSGAMNGLIDVSAGSQGITFNATGKRSIYAFTVGDKGASLLNEGSIWLAQDWIPDRLKVARNG